MKKTFFIKGPRQKRAIIALLEKSISVSALGLVIGALNPRQIISELRQQGFKGIILTRRYSMIDQDGKKCRPGEYYILEYFKPLIEELLKETAQTPIKLLDRAAKTPGKDNNRRAL